MVQIIPATQQIQTPDTMTLPLFYFKIPITFFDVTIHLGNTSLGTKPR